MAENSINEVLKNEVTGWLRDGNPWDVSDLELQAGWGLLVTDRRDNRIVVGQVASTSNESGQVTHPAGLLVQAHVSLDQDQTSMVSGFSDVDQFLETMRAALDALYLEMRGLNPSLERIGLLESIPVLGITLEQVINSVTNVRSGISRVITLLGDRNVI